MSTFTSQLEPLRLPAFRKLFLATLGSSVGTLMAAVALTLDVQERTKSSPHTGLWVGAVLVVEFLPTVIVGLFLGPLIDRLPRRSLMIAADAVRVGVFVALPFAPSAGVVVALAFVAGLATGFFRPAVYAGVPNLVEDELLPQANALLQTVENLSWTLGPILGAVAGPNISYAINAASFVVSIVLIWGIPARLLQSERALTRGYWRDLADGFAATLRSRSMVAVVVAWGIASFGVGAMNVSQIFLAKHTFSSGSFGYGLLYGAVGAGLVLGAFSSAQVLERFGVGATYGTGLAVMGVGLVAAAVSPNVWVAAACCVVIGVGNGTAVACNALLVQRGTFDVMRGRALTFVMSATYLAVAIGEFWGGAFVHEGVAPDVPRWLWGVAGISLGVAAVAGWAIARKLGGETAAQGEHATAGAAMQSAS
ncbi:MAG TPA: MFS transporter [Gaiellaceae bacterium]